MIKIFFYELRRAVCNKFYLGLLLLSLCMGWLTLRSSIIQGIAHTAPFSPWSFGFYLAQLAPLMCLAFLVLQWKLVCSHAQAVRTLTRATPMGSIKFLLLQCAAISTAWIFLACSVSALGAAFLLHLFAQAVNLSAFVLPTLAALLPLLIFVMGIGLLAGGFHPAALIVLAPLLAALGMLPLPFSLELFGSSFFSGYPLTLAVADPAFTMPAEVLAGKAVYLLCGVLCLALACRRTQKKF